MSSVEAFVHAKYLVIVLVIHGVTNLLVKRRAQDSCLAAAIAAPGSGK
jgi:hypothetical protein